MSTLPNTPQYTEYHPRWYRKRVSTYWWMGSWKYMKFILRELSSIFVALPDIMIAAPNYFAWAAISVVVGWFILRS